MECHDISLLQRGWTTLTDKNQLAETDTRYIFWNGKPKGEKIQGSIGFPVCADLMNQLKQPHSLCDMIMNFQVSLLGDFNAYAGHDLKT